MHEDVDKPIAFNRYIDKYQLEAPNGETYYFRDYEGAEDFLLLNFKDHIEDLATL